MQHLPRVTRRERSYSRWALQYDTLGDAEQAALHEQLRALRTLPLISIIDAGLQAAS
jgi:hypothetical protein